jgi:phage shock protein E
MQSRWLLKVVVLSTLIAGCAACRSLPPASAYADPDQLYSLIAHRLQPYVLVDVRTAGEYSSGHIPTAINIPFVQLDARLPTADRGALVIVYCASGGRSSRAAATLRDLGYTRVVDFGAVSRWPGRLLATSQPGDCPCQAE